MKRSHLPLFDWISPYSTTLARMLSLLGASLATVGIVIRYDPAAETLLLTNISVSSIALLTFELMKQFAMQEAVYRGAFKEKAG
jgi:energy-converting hydrogenase Eha subunit H